MNKLILTDNDYEYALKKLVKGSPLYVATYRGMYLTPAQRDLLIAANKASAKAKAHKGKILIGQHSDYVLSDTSIERAQNIRKNLPHLQFRIAPNFHAKLILTPGYAIIGSRNFGSTSFKESNLLTTTKSIVSELRRQFLEWWEDAKELP